MRICGRTKSLSELTVRFIGLLMGDGETYFEQRNFLIRHLIRYNLLYEERITGAVNEINGIIEDQLKLNPEGVVNFESAFFAPVINILWELLAGRKLSGEDGEFQKIIANFKEFNRSLNQQRLFLPFPSRLFKMLPFLRKISGSQSELLLPMQELIQVISFYLEMKSKFERIKIRVD